MKINIIDLAIAVAAVCVANAVGGSQSLAGQKIVALPIDKIVLQRGKVRCQVKFSYGQQDYFHFVLVRIHSGSFVGYGEGIMKSFDGVEPIAKKLIGKDAFGLDNLLPSKGWCNPREAMSMALHWWWC